MITIPLSEHEAKKLEYIASKMVAGNAAITAYVLLCRAMNDVEFIIDQVEENRIQEGD